MSLRVRQRWGVAAQLPHNHVCVLAFFFFAKIKNKTKQNKKSRFGDLETAGICRWVERMRAPNPDRTRTNSLVFVVFSFPDVYGKESGTQNKNSKPYRSGKKEDNLSRWARCALTINFNGIKLPCALEVWCVCACVLPINPQVAIFFFFFLIYRRKETGSGASVKVLNNHGNNNNKKNLRTLQCKTHCQ